MYLLLGLRSPLSYLSRFCLSFYHFDNVCYKIYAFRIMKLFTHPFPKFGCINGTCTGLQPDNIVHRIQRAFTFKMMYMNLSGYLGGATNSVNNALIRFHPRNYNAFAGSGFCPVPGHVILTCKLHISGKI